MEYFLNGTTISKKWLITECSLGIVVCVVVVLDFFLAKATIMRCEATHAARSCVKVEKSMTLKKFGV